MASNSRKKEGRGGFSPEGDNINKETRTGNTRRLSPHLQGTTESIRTGRKPIRGANRPSNTKDTHHTKFPKWSQPKPASNTKTSKSPYHHSEAKLVEDEGRGRGGRGRGRGRGANAAFRQTTLGPLDEGYSNLTDGMGTTLETGDEQKNNYRIAECNTIFVDEGVRYRHPRGMPPPEFDSDHEFDRDTPSFPIISGSGPSTRAPNSINTGRSVGRALGGPKDPQRRSRVAGLQSSLSQPPSFDTVKGKNVPNAGSRLFSRIKAHDQVGDILHETRHAESNRGGPPPAYSPGVRGSGKGKVTVARSDKVMNRGYRYDDDDD